MEIILVKHLKPKNVIKYLFYSAFLNRGVIFQSKNLILDRKLYSTSLTVVHFKSLLNFSFYSKSPQAKLYSLVSSLKS